MGESTLRLIWGRSGSTIGGQSGNWNITIDCKVARRVASQETADGSMPPGHHTQRLGSGRKISPPRAYDVAADEVVSFRCHGPGFRPRILAAQVQLSHGSRSGEAEEAGAR